MVHLIVELSKYALIILFSVYTYECFAVFRNISEQKQEKKANSNAKLYLIKAKPMMWYGSLCDSFTLT